MKLKYHIPSPKVTANCVKVLFFTACTFFFVGGILGW